MTDENGEVVWQADYLPFGEVNVTVDVVENQFRFPGQYFDAESGLHYNYHRYYDPRIGRYKRTDPIGMPGVVNLFTYVVNNPYRYIDPGKLGPKGAIAGGIFGAGVGVIAGAIVTTGTLGGGVVISPAIVAWSAALGAGIGHYAEEGIKGIIGFFNPPFYQSTSHSPGYIDWEEEKKRLKTENECPKLIDAGPIYYPPDQRDPCQKLGDSIKALAKKNPNIIFIVPMALMYVLACGDHFDSGPGSGNPNPAGIYAAP